MCNTPIIHFFHFYKTRHHYPTVITFQFHACKYVANKKSFGNVKAKTCINTWLKLREHLTCDSNVCLYDDRIHICVTMPITQSGVADKFIKDFKEATAKIMKNPKKKTTGGVRKCYFYFLLVLSGTIINFYG